MLMQEASADFLVLPTAKTDTSLVRPFERPSDIHGLDMFAALTAMGDMRRTARRESRDHAAERHVRKCKKHRPT